MANAVTLMTYLLVSTVVGGICHSTSPPPPPSPIQQQSSLMSHYLQDRKSCQTSSNCRDPFKECIDGLCFCKPELNDVLHHGEDECMLAYGSKCSKPPDSKSRIYCNVHKHLTCGKEGVCTCNQPKGGFSLVYNEQLQTCVALPGDMCELNVEDANNYGQVLMGCVSNAECNPDPKRNDGNEKFFGVCECSTSYVRNSKGERCVPELGSKCEVDSDCDDIYDGGVGCIGGECRCAKDRLHDKVQHKCRLKVGMSCDMETENCVEGANCILISRKNDSSSTSAEGNNNYKWGWECACGLSYHEDDKTGSGGCVKDNLDACGDGTVFDEVRGRCSIAVGNQCKTHGPNRCVKHAYCSGTTFKCQCYAGYKKAEDQRFCEKEEEEIIISSSPTKIPETTLLPPMTANRRISVSSSSSTTSLNYKVVPLSLNFNSLGVPAAYLIFWRLYLVKT